MGKMRRIVRVLITVTPRMYREAITLFIHRQRPGHEVRMVSPEGSADDVARFRPHLLVRNDNDRFDQQALASVPFWVEVSYWDGMDATISANGEVSELDDISMEDLLRVVDEAAAHAG
jgi:hypothetical protein